MLAVCTLASLIRLNILDINLKARLTWVAYPRTSRYMLVWYVAMMSYVKRKRHVDGIHRRTAARKLCLMHQAALISHSPWNEGGSTCFHMMSQRYKQAESWAIFHGPIPVTHMAMYVTTYNDHRMHNHKSTAC